MNNKYVLLIEDDAFVQKVYQLKFTKLNINFRSANNGKEALEIIKETKAADLPAVVMLDLMLPFVSGFEVLEVMRKTPGWEKVPVLILSNLSQDIDMDRARKLGVKEYLVKADMNIDDVVKKISEYL